MASPVIATRQSESVFLLGIKHMDSLVELKKLPTNRQVLLRFHWHLQSLKSVRNASHVTVEELNQLWAKAYIPTRLPKHSIDKIEKLHASWLLLKKNKSRKTKSQKDREANFVDALDLLFDIAHADALTMIKIEEDRQFLEDQRRERKMVMTTVDKVFTKKQERSRKREMDQEERKNKSQLLSPAIPSTSRDLSFLDTAESSNESHDYSEDEVEYKPSLTSLKKMKYSEMTDDDTADGETSTSIKSLFTSEVTSALDRNKVSDREALRLIVPLAAALGEDPAAMSISRTTIQRARKKGRKDLATVIKDTFKPQYPLVVHWDGKILPEIIGTEKVDRLPILVSGGGQEKLLAVPKVASGTGENAAKAVFNAVVEWKLEDQIQAMCFDTTASNTGQKNGACTILEDRFFGRELLWLACRHHIMEIILAEVFSLCTGSSSGPDIQMFKRFKNSWNGFERSNYKSLEMDDWEVTCHRFKNDSIEYLSQVSKWQSQPRDDYKEIIELALTVLDAPPSEIHWRAPGPVHHARWMAKLIYAMKIYLFRHQRDVFKLTAREEAQLKRFVTFGALLYTAAWIKAPLTADAPSNDLKFWLDLKDYEVIDKEISQTALKKFERHLWYLSEEVIGLSLFSETVSEQEKKDIIAQMSSVQSSNTRKVRGNPELMKCNDLKLSHFATAKSKVFFDKMNICTSFFELEPNTWEKNEAFLDGLLKIKQLIVVNDVAERGVKMFEDFNKILTKNEEDKQFLLQVVEANRKAIPTQTTKKTALLGLARHEQQ